MLRTILIAAGVPPIVCESTQRTDARPIRYRMRNASLPKRRMRARSSSDSHSERRASPGAGASEHHHSRVVPAGAARRTGVTNCARSPVVTLQTPTPLNTMSAIYRRHRSWPINRDPARPSRWRKRRAGARRAFDPQRPSSSSPRHTLCRRRAGNCPSSSSA